MPKPLPYIACSAPVGSLRLGLQGLDVGWLEDAEDTSGKVVLNPVSEGLDVLWELRRYQRF